MTEAEARDHSPKVGVERVEKRPCNSLKGLTNTEVYD